MTVFTKRKVVMESDVSDSSSEDEQEVQIVSNVTKKAKIGDSDEESHEEDDDSNEEREQSGEQEEIDDEHLEEEDSADNGDEDADDEEEAGDEEDDDEEEAGDEDDEEEAGDDEKANDEVNVKKVSKSGSNDTDSDKESDEQERDENDEDLESQNIGWADSIANILKTNKPKTKKTLVLSKARKLNDVRREKPKPAGFEVEKVDGEVKEEQIEPEEEKKEEAGPPRKKKKEIPSIRKKPNVLEKDHEKMLMKIATKGVVQLFNAVKNQQKEIETKLKEAGPLDVKKQKALKNINKQAFLDSLQKSKAVDSKDSLLTAKSNERNVEEDAKTTWSVLRDDFMMGGKMKNWDKELEGEDEEMEAENEVESD